MVKRCIEDRHLRLIGSEKCTGRANTVHASRIVQRRQFDALLDGFEHVIIDHDGFGESLAAVHDAMSHRVHLSSSFRLLQNLIKRPGTGMFHFAAAETLIFVLRDPIRISGDELKLQARTSGVENEYIHKFAKTASANL